MNSAGRPHSHVPCPACVLFRLSRSDTATLFVNVFTLFTIVNIAAEEPSVDRLDLFYTRRVPMTDCGRFAPASPILPVGAWTSNWFPICREWVVICAPWSCGPYLSPHICECVPPRVPQHPISEDFVSPIGERGWCRPISPSTTPRRPGSLRVAALLHSSPPLLRSHVCLPKFGWCQPGRDRRQDSGCGLINGIHQDPLMFCQVFHSRVISSFCSFVSINKQSYHNWPYIEDLEINRGHSAQPWLEFCKRLLRHD